MKAIVIVDKSWAIGRDRKLLMHLPTDLEYFKEKTEGKTLVMGRTTLESLPGGKPLPNRKHIVLTRNVNLHRDDCILINSLEEALIMVKAEPTDSVMICGGEDVYRQFLPYVDGVLVTKIDADLNGDTYFPNLNEDDDFKMVWSSPSFHENGVDFNFTEYIRVKNRKE